jgi:sporulation-control protein
VVFKKMLGALGMGGLKVDTVLSTPGAHPGAALTGQVNLVGGSADADIEHITLGLATRMEIETGHGDHAATGEFHRLTVSGPLRLAAGQHLSLPFQLVLPWETPITTVYGQPLRGMVMGVRTEVSIARAIDKGDLDPVQIHPLPVQQRILDAFAQLGFVFKSADLEYGQIAGVHQTLPFCQEIEYFPAQQYAGSLNEVELTFVTSPHQVDVILEFDKRGGMFGGGHDSYGRYTVSHTEADTTDWTQIVDGWIRQAFEHRQAMPGYGQPAYGAPAPGYGQPAYGHGQPGYGHGQPAYGHGQPGYGHDSRGHGHGGHGGHGSGMAGVAMGAVGGLAAGYMASEIIDDVFEGDEEEGED